MTSTILFGCDGRRPAQYRGSGARRDVEQRNAILGALRNHVVLRNRIEGLEVHQHLIGLVDAGGTRWAALTSIEPIGLQ